MKIIRLIGFCVVLFSCEKVYQTQPHFTGTWQITLEMYDDKQLISELHGDMIFYADQTAKLHLAEDDPENSINYNWHKQENHIVLVNQSTNFPLPYYIVSQTDNYIELSQTEDVKMKLFR